MTFKQYFIETESLFREVIKKRFHIKHKRWLEISMTMDSYTDTKYSISTGVYGKEVMTSLNAAFNFTLSNDEKALALFNYIFDEIKGLNYEGQTVHGIANVIISAVKPIITHFQKTEDIEGVKNNGLADKIDSLPIDINIKNEILENLNEIEEYLPKDLILKPNEALILIVYKIYNALHAKSLKEMIRMFQELENL